MTDISHALFHGIFAVPGNQTIDMLVIAANLIRICTQSTYLVKNTQNFFLLRQGNLSIHRIQFIENEAAIGTGKTVQTKDIPMLFEKSPYLCLLPVPSLTQFF